MEILASLVVLDLVLFLEKRDLLLLIDILLECFFDLSDQLGSLLVLLL